MTALFSLRDGIRREHPVAKLVPDGPPFDSLPIVPRNCYYFCMVTLWVNGQQRSLDLDLAVPLLWALRDELGLVGTKFGCGGGFCGACTVHIDGVARRSCVTPIGSVDSARVVTIEGLHPDGRHPLQVAWQEEDVPQCGYCQAGQIMTAASLLAAHPSPTTEQLDAAMSGNLCRCGTYPRIRRAILKAARAGQPQGGNRP